MFTLPFVALGVLAAAIFSDNRYAPTTPDQYGGYRPVPGGVDIGLRGPTTAWRHPMPRPWEVPSDYVNPQGLHEEELYGLSTGVAGIRGVHLGGFTPEEIRAYNIEGARQGLRGSSVAPPG